eukprot:scaffold4914_cov108-Cylindrotheca_fusiformis.AAC.2
MAMVSSAGAFVPHPNIMPSHKAVAMKVSVTPVDGSELAAAISDVRAAASAFSDETEHFANVWIERVLAGEQEGMPSGLLEECLMDDGGEKCQRFEQALKRLDAMVGVGVGEQY